MGPKTSFPLVTPVLGRGSCLPFVFVLIWTLSQSHVAARKLGRSTCSPSLSISPCSSQLDVADSCRFWSKSRALGEGGGFLGQILYLFGNQAKHLLTAR